MSVQPRHTSHAMASEGRVWEDLRREARSIERRLESGIQRYTALETRYDLENPKSFQEDEQVEGEIEVC